MPQLSQDDTDTASSYSSSRSAENASTNASLLDNDITGVLLQLADLVKSQPHPIHLPDGIKERLDDVAEYLTTVIRPPSSQISSEPTPATILYEAPRPSRAPPTVPENPTIEEEFKLNRTTTLGRLYKYTTPNSIVEFPESGLPDRPIGYLFAMDPEDWINPTRNFVYSQGEPKGQKFKEVDGSLLKNRLLVDDSGKEVPCKVSSSTCQGVKICPFADIEEATAPHSQASREMLAERLKAINSVRRRSSAPNKEIFLKTFEYFAALKRQGCGAPLFEETVFTEVEEIEEERRAKVRERERRGHVGKATCKGRLLLEYTSDRRIYIRCEHYNRRSNVDHFIDYNAGAGLFDAEYLEALFRDDKEFIDELEEDVAATSNIGPRSKCCVVSNYSTIKTTCSFTHRTSDRRLENPDLIHLPCTVKFRIYEPLEEYRSICPWALVVCKGQHKHPIPIPSRTPPSIRSEIDALLRSLKEDLPDLTPRRFLRHPSLKSYLERRLPKISNPALLDLHPSLANRDHLRGIISSVQKEIYPEGTGWEGLLYQKQHEDENLPEEDRYIRFVGEEARIGGDLETDDPTEDPTAPFRIVICMLKQNSIRLLKTQYIQSDIGFKRVAGFKEFELGGLDDSSRKSITYCRIFVNRQSAEAHRLVFHKIDEIVFQDTGERLKWRHLHSPSLDIKDAVGIFQLAVDQHGGQAKGFGLYLQDVARSLPIKADLHQPHRNIQDLSEYEHLRRILRLCKNHFIRNIQKCGVPDAVKKKMLSLLCMEHPSWDATVAEIEAEGGKSGKDWVADKIRSQFAFQGVCWEKSYIPREIWQAGEDTTNIIESLHEDVNREGLSCTLLGGIHKGRHFDLLKDRTLKILESTGITPSYRPGGLNESMARSVKRKSNLRHKLLDRQDKTLVLQNAKLEKAHENKVKANQDFTRALQTGGPVATVEKAAKKKERADQHFEQALSSSLSHLGSGSGKVGLLLPSDSVRGAGSS